MLDRILTKLGHRGSNIINSISSHISKITSYIFICFKQVQSETCQQLYSFAAHGGTQGQSFLCGFRYKR